MKEMATMSRMKVLIMQMHLMMLFEASYEEESCLSDSDYQVSTTDSSDAERNANQNDSDTEVNESQDNDDQDSVLVQNDGEWNKVGTAKSCTFPLRREDLLVLIANTSKVWPIDMYQLFVTDDVVDFIVVETNRFSIQVLASQTVSRVEIECSASNRSGRNEDVLGHCYFNGNKSFARNFVLLVKSKLYQWKLISD